MKITFILNSVGVNGRCRAVFECANRLHERGHEVSIVYPLLPLRIRPGLGLMERVRNLVRDAKSAVKGLLGGKAVRWFPVKVRLIRVLTLSPNLVRFFGGGVPDGDAVVATAWETAYTVHRLGAGKGRKFYFVQHYEVWDAWNSAECWAEADKIISGGQENILLAMASVDPGKGPVKSSKELVDASYRLPLKKITTSYPLRRLMEDGFGEKTEQVALGVNPEHFYPEGPKRGRGKTVAMPYRRCAWKGEHDGVKALEIVKKTYPEARFILYGAKDEHVPCWLRAFNRGPVQGAALRRLYSQADVFVFTSWVEGWALPPMEAMACGTACVTTNVGAVMEYTVPGHTAVVVEPRSPEKIAGAVISLLGDKGKTAGLARDGHEFMARFSWDRTAREMEKALAA